MSLLDSVFQQLAQAFQALGAFVTPFLGPIFQPIVDFVMGFVTVFRGVLQSLGAALITLRQWAEAELGKLADLLTALEQQLADVADTLAHLSAGLSERVRQYLLARLRANPLGVLSEPFLLLQQAGGAPQLPDPNLGAPWTVLDEVLNDVAGYGTDPAHAAYVALEELLADLRAVAAGAPPPVAAAPSDPAQVAGFPALSDPAGADPNAAGLLTADDQSYVAQTTAGGSA